MRSLIQTNKIMQAYSLLSRLKQWPVLKLNDMNVHTISQGRNVIGHYELPHDC